MKKPLLDIRELAVTFRSSVGEVRAVDNISFSIDPGECVGLVGESGSGKSVTALSVMRLLDFEPGDKELSGRIRFRQGEEETELTGLSAELMRRFRGKRIAMVFQEPQQALNPVFPCGYQLAEAVRLHRPVSLADVRSVCLDLLDRVQVADPERIYDSYPFQISGGQKQRVLIAIALAGEPDLLVADEPTTALDLHVQKSILDLLDQLRRDLNMALLFISHDLGVIHHIADRVLVMKDGHIVESGPAAEVFRNPRHPYTRGLLACRPEPAVSLRRLPIMADFQPAASGEIPDLAAVRQRIGPARERSFAGRETILRAEDIQVHFPRRRKHLFAPNPEPVRAVDGVNLAVRAGETVGLVGASGSGKTTLGRALLRLLPLHSGQIHFRDQEITRLEARSWHRLRRRLQMVFQDPYASLNPRISVGEAIREPLGVHGLVNGKNAQRERVVELLELVGMEADHYHRAPYAFSGGQRQRLCIARALAAEPDFLICDESVSALDVSVQAQVLNLLRDLQEQLDFACVFISHDLAVVQFIADRVLVMDAGKVVEEGRPAELFRNPQAAATRRLVEAVL